MNWQIESIMRTFIPFSRVDGKLAETWFLHTLGEKAIAELVTPFKKWLVERIDLFKVLHCWAFFTKCV